ncbi:MAG: ribbon-helix-helix domain-containing protein [Sphingorhabdus sp.]|uniref:ribbon-helix-helix domain-containing protein n=1 Tax=Sphingorhabdus sp. TaxID=1902408 RepID=UPI0038FC7DC2
MRILTEIPDADVKQLDALASKKNSSRAAAIRDAVKLYLVQNTDNNDWIERWAGLWEHRDDIPDGVEYQRAMREDRRPYEDI